MSAPQSAQNANDGTTVTAKLIIAPPTQPPTTAPWSVQSVLSALPTATPSTPPSSPLPFLHLLSRLKTTPREGWRRSGIVNGESIADHMYRMSIMTMLAPPSLTARLDIPRCTKMALVHDMAESLVGDITPRDEPTVPKAEKARREAETMEYFCGTLLGAWAGGKQGKGIREVFVEYEEAKTEESVFVHDVDKVELLLQMMEYEQEGKGELDLGEFTQVANKIKLEEMKGWAREIFAERKGFWEEVGKVPKNLEEQKGF